MSKQFDRKIIFTDKFMFFMAMFLRLVNFSQIISYDSLEIIEMCCWVYVVFITIIVYLFSPEHRRRIEEYFDTIFGML